MNHAISIKNVNKTYSGKPPVTALDDISIDILDNEFFTLLGPSGCGKTTLLRSIAGFEAPTRGEITLYGEDLLSLAPFERPVNTVFQSYALFPHLTVGQNIGFALKMLKKPKAEIDSTVVEMLELVQMGHLRDRFPNELSGGQQQRVALARALAPKPKVLLLDEPLSALDSKLRKEMQIELKRLQNETGITFIFVTHDQEEALTMSDRIAVMKSGTVQQIGTPSQIYDQPINHFVADFIGDTNFVPVTIKGKGKGKRANQVEISLPSGEGIFLSSELVPEGAGEASLVMRPEHMRLGSAKGAPITGELENLVYFGTDTHFYVNIGTDLPLVVRVQNHPDHMPAASVGEAVGVYPADGSMRVLVA